MDAMFLAWKHDNATFYGNCQQKWYRTGYTMNNPIQLSALLSTNKVHRQKPRQFTFACTVCTKTESDYFNYIYIFFF